jgi:hypothetical protein
MFDNYPALNLWGTPEKLKELTGGFETLSSTPTQFQMTAIPIGASEINWMFPGGIKAISDYIDPITAEQVFNLPSQPNQVIQDYFSESLVDVAVELNLIAPSR